MRRPCRSESFDPSRVGAHAPIRESVDNRASRSIVAMASTCEIEQRHPHRFELARLIPEFFSPCDGECLDLGAGTIAITPERQQFADFLDRKAEIAGVRDEAKAVDVSVRIVAIPAIAARSRGHQADLLVMPDHALRDAAGFRGMPDVHRFTRLSRNALVTTLTEESAIAAAAIMGESRMPNTG